MIFKKKHLHIVSDEKFIDAAYRVFEEVRPGENDFVILGRKRKLVHVKDAKVLFIRPTLLWFFRRLLYYRYKSIVFHRLDGKFLKLLTISVSSKIPLFWIGWGFDYYEFCHIKLYKQYTQDIVDGFQLGKSEAVSHSFIPQLDRAADMNKVFDRINFFGPVLQSEYLVLSKFYPQNKMEFLDWNYLTLEDDIINGFEEQVITGNNLMLGNSANPVNNQIDAFDDILDFKFSYDDIVCPLSYGDGRYRDIVVDRGKLLFSERFKPITSFLPYHNYVDQIISCRYVFINSYRQVAMGNILLMLYLGAYVILEKSNPSYAFFVGNGIQVFSVDEAKWKDFPEIDLSSTRRKLAELWGRKIIKEKTKIVFDKLEAAYRNGI